MVEKINRLKNWQAALLIALMGFAVYSIGLANSFEGDDFGQIINNTAVHSIMNIGKFFESGTYAGNGVNSLSGTYYRPLMTTVFSIIYTVFGPHPFYFHLFQLLVCIGSAIILYLFFRYSFKPPLALFLSLVFLTHPIDSQTVYAIPSMQDALFFFFGILGVYLLVRYRSIRSLVCVALCLFLSLLAKESAMLFVIMSLIYLFWWNRKRFLTFLGIVLVPVGLWLLLRIHAVGVFSNPAGGPIDRLGLAGRLFTSPSIMLFYITKFVYPWKLASTYYWTYPTYSTSHFLFPLLIDLTVVVLIIYVASIIRKKAPKSMLYTYLFFAIWGAIGLGLLLQIVPLDMTACETWFYFPMVGFIGMIGVVFAVFPIRIQSHWLVILAIVFLTLFGTRTLIRGLDWRSQYELAKTDIANSQDNSRAYSIIVYTLMQEGNYSGAKPYQTEALRIYPSYGGYVNYATILSQTGDYAGAVNAYKKSIPYGTRSSNLATYDTLGYYTLLTGSVASNKAYLVHELHIYPKNSLLWMYLAFLEEKDNDNTDAKIAISNAKQYGKVPQYIYDHIIKNQPFVLDLSGQPDDIP